MIKKRFFAFGASRFFNYVMVADGIFSLLYPINPAIKYLKPSSSLVGGQTVQQIESKERFRTRRNDKIQVFDCRFNNKTLLWALQRIKQNTIDNFHLCF
jgi:hypothetical protein